MGFGLTIFGAKLLVVDQLIPFFGAEDEGVRAVAPGQP